MSKNDIYNKKTSGKISLVAHFNQSSTDYRLINPSVSLLMAS